VVLNSLVIITGASSGLGLALATSVPFPARTIDFSRSGPPDHAGIEHVVADLSDPRTWSTTATAISTAISGTDPNRSVFIHCAGTLTPIGPVSHVDDDVYISNVLLNSAAGQVLGMAYLKALAGRAGDHDLVMVSSGAATTAYPGWAAYGAGKAALNQWVRAVGKEQQIDGGVRVSAIAPGVVDTAMQAEIRGTNVNHFPDVDRFRRLKEAGDLISPEEAARKMWAAIESRLESGAVIDLRNF
jgi:benzil reductase ((S)-benzoin forming)